MNATEQKNNTDSFSNFEERMDALKILYDGHFFDKIGTI